jgi:cellulose synthase/poly-beta-1,6-N-acetylglucosamine synthase-like glycosyltransferase
MPPLVSVIIPCRNEAKTIDRVLEALDGQTFGRDRMEVIVADGRSEDDSRARVERFAHDHPALHVTVVDNPGRTAPAGLNRAWRATRGEFVLRVDGHAVPRPDYIEHCVSLLESTGCAGVGGAWDILPGASGTIASAIAAAAGHPLGAGGTRYRLGGSAGEVDTVPFGAYRRSAIERLGGFNEAVPVNEDYEFNYRLRQTGGRLLFSPEIRSTYIARPTLAALARQYFRYGLQKTVMLSFHPAALRPRQAAPALWVALLLALAIGAIFTPLARILLAAFALAYAAVLLAAGILRAARLRAAGMVWALPLALASMHIAWGLGFWWGWFGVARRARGARAPSGR